MCDCNCSDSVALDPLLLLEEDQLEAPVYLNFRLWHVIFMGFASVMAVVVCICCCVRFRIPRTKQEIEADYVRKKITHKFKKQLQLIRNTDMDEMDLKKALEIVRAEFKASEAEAAHLEDLSQGSGAVVDDSVFRGNVGSTAELTTTNKGLGARIMSFMGFLRLRKTNHNQPTEDKQLKLEV